MTSPARPGRGQHFPTRLPRYTRSPKNIQTENRPSETIPRPLLLEISTRSSHDASFASHDVKISPTYVDNLPMKYLDSSDSSLVAGIASRDANSGRARGPIGADQTMHQNMQTSGRAIQDHADAHAQNVNNKCDRD